MAPWMGTASRMATVGHLAHARLLCVSGGSGNSLAFRMLYRGCDVMLAAAVWQGLLYSACCRASLHSMGALGTVTFFVV